MAEDARTREAIEEWLDRILADPEIPRLAFVVAYVFAQLYVKRETWPTLRYFAARTGVSHGHVCRLINILERKGYLEIKRGLSDRNQSNQYHLQFPSHLSPHRPLVSSLRSHARAYDNSRPADFLTNFFSQFTATPEARPNEYPLLPGPVSRPAIIAPTTVEPATRFRTEPITQMPGSAHARAGKNGWPPNGFDIWWQMYPCKKNKPKARKAWHAMVKARKTTFSNVLQGTDRYRRLKPRGQDWCHGASFLNGARYNDDYSND
jgi:hypothetical protein